MDESRKQFQSWFADEIVGADVEFPEFEDGEYVAGEIYDEQLYVMLQAMYMAWIASRAAIEIELPAKMIFPAMTTPFLTRLIGMMEETLVFRNAQKPSAPPESK